MMNTSTAGPGIIIIPRQEFNSYAESRNLIEYITRSGKRSNQSEDLLIIGARGVQISQGIETVIHQFEHIQGMYKPRCHTYGRHCHHEFYCLKDTLVDLCPSLFDRENMKELAYRLSDVYWEKRHQVVYAVHCPDRNTGHYHIHFAVNSICLENGHKWNTTEVYRQKRERVLNDITMQLVEKLLND
ncbi:relaxase/mobilization nuclease domain-containing protein [Enterocloster clostridioformis]|nr:relaxase/mobilization nuclease domain-containing protein [Enterocloster clostridioformis]MDB2130897.1 relaxase/mobilization nuclease domain-containing protein [Enterocloster clostridioformis]MDU1962453.1 relaxase/mobilization nuclease domain-containing protein [Enterocloster clostridioformis]